MILTIPWNAVIIKIETLKLLRILKMKTISKSITIRDIAREARVSLGTVSGILNGNNNFSEKTKKLVWKTAHQLNYSPNTEAKQLRSRRHPTRKRSKTGVILHVAHLGKESPVGNSFESDRSVLLSWEASKVGLYPISYWYYQRKGFQCPPVLNGTVDGAIVGTLHMDVVNILKDKLPVVMMDVPLTLGCQDATVVNMDSQNCILKIVDELYRLGHRRIGMMYSTHLTDGVSLEIPLMNSFREVALSNNMEILPEWVIADDIVRENNAVMMKKIAEKFKEAVRERAVTAIVCPHTTYATVLYENLVGLGVKVPEEVSIAALIHSGFRPPALEICANLYNWPQMVRTALEVLRQLIDGKKLPFQKYLIKPEYFPGKTLAECK